MRARQSPRPPRPAPRPRRSPDFYAAQAAIARAEIAPRGAENTCARAWRRWRPSATPRRRSPPPPKRRARRGAAASTDAALSTVGDRRERGHSPFPCHGKGSGRVFSSQRPPRGRAARARGLRPQLTRRLRRGAGAAARPLRSRSCISGCIAARAARASTAVQRNRARADR